MDSNTITWIMLSIAIIAVFLCGFMYGRVHGFRSARRIWKIYDEAVAEQIKILVKQARYYKEAAEKKDKDATR